MNSLAPHLRRAFAITALIAAPMLPTAASAATPSAATQARGVLRTSSAHSVDETVSRIKTAVEAKGIRFFTAIDHQQLGASANLPIRKSVLVMFGNPPLGVQFIQANPYAGLDWPVRMLVREGADGRTEIAWTDFAAIGQRYGITGKDAQLKMASEVAATVADEAGR
ncbi:DUF302 domain-containing protein [Sphingomonas arenae]|uniref:DUF302 domain-containing protein n=1 Tax=Sphingomonas arenae TaxID=2812555 RepID=UPI00196700E4|nr:DUF302 domain-containing protein [Sphingomonas arenae]